MHVRYPVCYRWTVTRKCVTRSQKQTKVMFPGVLPLDCYAKNVTRSQKQTKMMFPGVLLLGCYPKMCFPKSKTGQSDVTPCVTAPPMLRLSPYSESHAGRHGL